MLRPKVLVLTGEGINCEKETAFAFEKAGADAKIKTLNKLIENPNEIDSYDILAIPGGFSYGDEIGSGQVFSLKLKKHLGGKIEKFILDKKPIIGICNGFQVLTKLGLFDSSEDREVGLAPNSSGTFINKWAALNVHPKSNCIWTKELETSFSLPVRHGEGRIVLSDEKVYSTLENNGQVVLSYESDFNGSYKNIAGLSDKSGLVFGLMPHPEADLYKATSPLGSEDPLKFSLGHQIFKNSVQYSLDRKGKN